MPLPPAIMQRLQADAVQAALQSTTDSRVHTPQPSLYQCSEAAAQEGLVPSASHEGDARALEHEGMQAQLSAGQQKHRGSPSERAQTLHVMINASGTGIFSDSSADDVFDRELLELFRQAENKM